MNDPVQSTPRVPELAEIDATAAHAAFDRLADKIRGVKAGDVVVASVDTTKAAMVALATHHRLKPLRALLADTVRNFNPEHLDLLDDLALAMWHCAQLERNQEDPATILADLLPDAVKLKSTLLSQGRALAERGRLPLGAIEEYTAGTGFEDLANDLSGLAQLFRDKWSEVSGRCDVEEAELERASVVGAKILARLAVQRVMKGAESRGADGQPMVTARDLRRRAFSLLYVAYEEVRRAASATFWYERDGWESFAPSLWSYQGRGAPAGRNEPSENPKDLKPISG